MHACRSRYVVTSLFLGLLLLFAGNSTLHAEDSVDSARVPIVPPARPAEDGKPLDAERAELFGRVGGEFVELGSGRSHYFDYGDRSSREVVLFIHGFAGSGLEIERVAPLLVQAGYRVIAPDWPGAGISDALPEYSTEALIAWLEDFRRAIGIERFHLVGHSLGGFLAIRYAVAHPERLRRLVLIAPAGFEKELGVFLAALADSPPIVGAATALYIPGYYDIIASIEEFKDFSRAPKEVLEYNALALATASGRRGMKEIALRILGGEPDLDCLDRVAAPTLLLWAEDDRLLPYRWRETFLEGLPPATTFVPLSDCGHAPHMEQPLETATAILDFLRAPAPSENANREELP
jgi:pimeloyl-ACP methyl ester carboxylesterase